MINKLSFSWKDLSVDHLRIIVLVFSNVGKTLETSENMCKIRHLQVKSISLTTEELGRNIMLHIMYPLNNQNAPLGVHVPQFGNP